MVSRYYFIQSTEGCIAKVNELPERTEDQATYRLTVEVPDQMMAYFMVHTSNIRPIEGSWIRFHGSAKIEIGPGGREVKQPYWHDPRNEYFQSDQSKANHWYFRTLTESEIIRIGPPKFMALLRSINIALETCDSDYINTTRNITFMLSLARDLSEFAPMINEQLESLQTPDPGPVF